MAFSDRSTLILVAVIGLVGTLGAAAITNPSIFSTGGQAGPVGNAGQGEPGLALDPAAAAANPVKAITPPHAPEIQLNPSTQVWGEDTLILEIPAGEARSVDGRNLFASVMTFPQGDCRGPEYIAFTWQVRHPYPEGGDLEVRQLFQGGSTLRVAMGAMGSGQMDPCEVRIFKNNGLVPTLVELRYASAIDRENLTLDSDPPPAAEEGSGAEASIEPTVEAAVEAAVEETAK